MEQAVKQRLVGAVVLTALAVITIPMIFQADRPPGVQVPETIPPVPEHPAVAISEPQPVELPADRPNAEPVPVSQMYQMAGEPTEDVSAMPQGGVTDATVQAFLPAPAPPATPAVEAAPVKEPSVQTELAMQSPPVPSAPVAKLPPPEKPSPRVLDKSGLPHGWVVQVAAMTDRKKADALVAQLKLNGHAAFTTVTRDARGDTIRIFVGPKADKAAAQRTKQQVDGELGLQTMVKPFQP